MAYVNQMLIHIKYMKYRMRSLKSLHETGRRYGALLMFTLNPYRDFLMLVCRAYTTIRKVRAHNKGYQRDTNFYVVIYVRSTNTYIHTRIICISAEARRNHDGKDQRGSYIIFLVNDISFDQSNTFNTRVTLCVSLNLKITKINYSDAKWKSVDGKTAKC